MKSLIKKHGLFTILSLLMPIAHILTVSILLQVQEISLFIVLLRTLAVVYTLICIFSIVVCYFAMKEELKGSGFNLSICMIGTGISAILFGSTFFI